jgi:hypothetical protein
MRRLRLSSKLFRAARRVDDLEAIASGDPHRITRRAKNRIVRALPTKSAATRARLAGCLRLPEVHVVVSFVILVTIIPVVIAARLTGGSGIARTTTAR